MNEYLELLETEPKKTCFVLEGNEIIFYSDASGVKPLMDFYNQFGSKKDDLIVVDKIMGKGSTLLAILVNASKIVTYTISKDALKLAHKYKLDVYYETIVPYIINRDGSGRCPIEKALLEIDDINLGYKKIKETIKLLNNK